MKQSDVVIDVIKNNNELITLAELIVKCLKDQRFEFTGKTPEANIRRIVQQTPEIYKIRPGLYSTDAKLKEIPKTKIEENIDYYSHSYYQYLLLKTGELKKFKTFVPNQDKNNKTNNIKLGDVSSINDIPNFSYDAFKNKIRTVDVIWFEETLEVLMPSCLYEVESTTDIKNSLGKYVDLINFNTKNYIVADKSRERKFLEIMKSKQFELIKNKVKFMSYDEVVKRYEIAFLEKNLPIL